MLTQARLGWILGAFLVASPRSSAADPITLGPEPPLGRADVALMPQISWLRATDGPAPERADDRTLSAALVIMAGATDWLTGSVSLAYLDRTASLDAPTGGRVTRAVRGLGDLEVGASARAARWRLPRGALLLVPFARISLPTGADAAADALGRLPQRLQLGTGAWGATAGAMAWWHGGPLELAATASYAAHTAANAFDAGDELHLGLGAAHAIGRRWCRRVCRVRAAIETQVIHRRPDRGVLAPTDSGGLTALAAPGLQVAAGRHLVEAAIEVPLRQPSDQHVDFVISARYRVMLD